MMAIMPRTIVCNLRISRNLYSHARICADINLAVVKGCNALPQSYSVWSGHYSKYGLLAVECCGVSCIHRGQNHSGAHARARKIEASVLSALLHHPHGISTTDQEQP